MIKNNNQKIVDQIFRKMISYKKISIFAHDVIDNDAYGSCLALAMFLEQFNIEARIAGLHDTVIDNIKKYIDKDYLNDVDEEFASESLGVILDLGTSKNIISNKYKLCKETIRIDHHPFVEKFCDVEWVDTDYCSTCEMIGWFILHNDCKKMNKKIANALYVGILSDSGNLMFPSAKASAYELVAKFFDYNFDKQQKQDMLYLKDWDDFKSNQAILKKTKIIDNSIAYFVITPRMQKKYNISSRDAKVYLLSGIKQFKVWFATYYIPEKNKWKVSIRSREFPVRDVAIKFGGGGHVLASGFTIDSLKQINEIIEYIRKIIN